MCADEVKIKIKVKSTSIDFSPKEPVFDIASIEDLNEKLKEHKIKSKLVHMITFLNYIL